MNWLAKYLLTILGFGAVVLAVGYLDGCTPQELQQAKQVGVRVLNLDVTRCIERALLAGRKDLVPLCKDDGLHDALELIDQALAEQVCNLPDAGGQ